MRMKAGYDLYSYYMHVFINSLINVAVFLSLSYSKSLILYESILSIPLALITLGKLSAILLIPYSPYITLDTLAIVVRQFKIVSAR